MVETRLAQGRSRPCAPADTVTIGVQVNGKLRGQIEVPHDAAEDIVRERALALEGVQARAGRQAAPKRVIVVKGRIVNVVVVIEGAASGHRLAFALGDCLLRLRRACGFHPLYGSIDGGPGIDMSSIYVKPIPERIGYELGTICSIFSIPWAIPSGAKYRLEIDLKSAEGAARLPEQRADHALQCTISPRAMTLVSTRRPTSG